MLISAYIENNDWTRYLLDYVDDTEALVGKPGIAERLFPKLEGRTGAYWKVHKAAIEERIKRPIVFDATIPYVEMKVIVASKPVILGTKNLGGLPGGHIIIAKGVTLDGIICNDPFGNANTSYKDTSGIDVEYKDAFLKKHFSNHVIYVR